MFSALRRSFLGKPCFLLLNQNCCKLQASFFNHKRYIISSPFRNVDLYKVIRRYLASTDYPDHVIIKLPALSPTMEAGGVASWNKKEGDEVKEGDIIAEVETDKATVGLEADDSGFVAKILIPAGTLGIKVGTPICILVEKKEYVPAFKDYEPKKEADDVGPDKSTETLTPPTSSEKPKGQIIEPTKPVRKPAISFSGASKDEAKSSSQMSTPGAAKKPTPREQSSKEKYTDHPISTVRAVIAKRLVQSKKDAPHFYLNLEVEMTQMEAMRKVLNSELAKSGVKISVNDIIVKASALCCKEVPETNSSWMEKTIRQYNTVDVSVAVSTPNGLITPIVFDADLKVLRDISHEIKELAKRARQGKLKPHEFQGGTFTVSNLGMYGVTQFFAVINPPQSCILAVGASVEKLFMKDSKISNIGVKKCMNVSLSCDHRVVDGSVGAQWLKAFRHFIEQPKNMY